MLLCYIYANVKYSAASVTSLMRKVVNLSFPPFYFSQVLKIAIHIYIHHQCVKCNSNSNQGAIFFFYPAQ